MSLETSILAIDIGAGTQDILLLDPERNVENAVKLVLPSPTVVAARRIELAASSGCPVHLGGTLMGGGAVSRALGRAVQAGVRITASREAALTFGDDLARVRARGLEIVEQPPAGAVHVRLGDVDLAALGECLARYMVELPRRVAVAAQDHGFSPQASNRRARFKYWAGFLAAGGRLADLVFNEPPAPFTRLAAVRAAAGQQAWVMDTGAAAIWGLTLDAKAAGWVEEGFVALNVGNGHTLAALVRAGRVLGLAEHHTGLLDAFSLARLVERLAQGRLTNDEVFQAGGHGAAISPDYLGLEPFRHVAVTGPNRRLARGLGHMAAPFGDMMLTGCFGLAAAALGAAGERGMEIA